MQVILLFLSFSGLHFIIDLCSFGILFGSLLCYYINLHNFIPNQKYIAVAKEALTCPKEAHWFIGFHKICLCTFFIL